MENNGDTAVEQWTKQKIPPEISLLITVITKTTLSQNISGAMFMVTVDGSLCISKTTKNPNFLNVC